MFRLQSKCPAFEYELQLWRLHCETYAHTTADIPEVSPALIAGRQARSRCTVCLNTVRAGLAEKPLAYTHMTPRYRLHPVELQVSSGSGWQSCHLMSYAVSAVLCILKAYLCRPYPIRCKVMKLARLRHSTLTSHKFLMVRTCKSATAINNTVMLRCAGTLLRE